ncbi:MAG: hypothetical protein G01um101433_293 [Parcubacteria group bacterium Gr01-1014_33]|nr:MAG: hypothetical protein G01um101433_293 [Parcubacteria group bacterium Gr01-1014_33]
MDTHDYFRFIHDLYEFNDESAAINLYYKQPFLSSYEARSHKIERRREPIVDLLAYTLMPNHYHLLLAQRREGGITEFMHKLGGGYAMYFNQKYQRTGTLFQGPFKAVLVQRQAHLLHLPFYIHANPLDLKFPEWRQQNITNPKAAFAFLEQYRWSSFPDYIGKKNFPSLLTREPFIELFGPPHTYRAATMALLKEMDIETIREVALEDIHISV